MYLLTIYSLLIVLITITMTLIYFVTLEDSIAKYSELGNILAIGDFNSRTGTGP